MPSRNRRPSPRDRRKSSPLSRSKTRRTKGPRHNHPAEQERESGAGLPNDGSDFIAAQNSGEQEGGDADHPCHRHVDEIESDQGDDDPCDEHGDGGCVVLEQPDWFHVLLQPLADNQAGLASALRDHPLDAALVASALQ